MSANSRGVYGEARSMRRMRNLGMQIEALAGCVFFQRNLHHVVINEATASTDHWPANGFHWQLISVASFPQPNHRLLLRDGTRVEPIVALRVRWLKTSIQLQSFHLTDDDDAAAAAVGHHSTRSDWLNEYISFTFQFSCRNLTILNIIKKIFSKYFMWF